MEQSYRQLIEYAKIHLISLSQDSANVQIQMSEMDDWDSDEYKDLEIEDISLNGQMIGDRKSTRLNSSH